MADYRAQGAKFFVNRFVSRLTQRIGDMRAQGRPEPVPRFRLRRPDNNSY